MTDAEVAIVGAGFTGAALAIQVAAMLPAAPGIALVGRDGGFGAGVAYGTRDPLHRLNVAADRMSIFADDADDFVRWLAKDGATVADPAARFVPRADYRRYVADRLAAAEAGGAIARVNAAVEAVRPAGAGFEIACAGGATIRTRAVALCLGNAPTGLPLDPARIDPAAAARIVADPWSEGIDVAPEEDVLLVGTGLTTVDQVLSLAGRGHRGRIVAISRRGLLPAAHAAVRAGAAPAVIVPGTPLAAAFRAMRRGIEAATARGDDWRAVVDAVRPATQAIWDGFDAAERRRFLRHAAPYWGVVRHRTAPEVGATVAALRAEGRLEIRAARLAAIGVADGRLAVSLRPRGATAETTLVVDRVINCAGLDRSVVASANPVVRSLIADGLARADPIGLGFEVDAGCRLVAADGSVRPNLFALGPPTIGRFWECVAVPEIREQCRDVAATLARALPGGRGPGLR